MSNIRNDSNALSAVDIETLRSNPEALREKLSEYKWYHSIEVIPGVQTESAFGGYEDNWQFIKNQLAHFDFDGKNVLDVGCRDGMFSFEAERHGARSVQGIDNDISVGSVELLVPLFGSSLQMEEMNVYELDVSSHGTFDVVLLFGVLYHLRYPFWGLSRVASCVSDGGELLIETALTVDTEETKNKEILHCPTENSPYEITSCTFFNLQGLLTTMKSFGFSLEHQEIRKDSCGRAIGDGYDVQRVFLHFRKSSDLSPSENLERYWYKKHGGHSGQV